MFSQSKPIINCTLTPVLTSLLVQSGTTSFLAETLNSELGIIVAAAIFFFFFNGWDVNTGGRYLSIMGTLFEDL